MYFIIRGSPPPGSALTVCPYVTLPGSHLSLRIGLRRFTRLTNGFSKKWKNHCAAIMLWYCGITSGVFTSRFAQPAIAAGFSDHVWSVRELLEAA